MTVHRSDNNSTMDHDKLLTIVAVSVFLLSLIVTFVIDGIIQRPYSSASMEAPLALIQSVPGYEHAASSKIDWKKWDLNMLAFAEMDGQLHAFLFSPHPLSGRYRLVDVKELPLDYSGTVEFGKGPGSGCATLSNGVLWEGVGEFGESLFPLVRNYLLVATTVTVVITVLVWLVVRRKAARG